MDIVSIIVAAVGSGLVATIITLIVQRVSETRKLKICIFEILMSHRYLIADKENVEALNKVEVIFHKDSEVRKAWTDFLNAADAGATNPTLARTTNDKYLKLLEKIAKNIGYKNIDWENIKHFYFPQGLATKITEEELLRKAQLSQATAILIILRLIILTVKSNQVIRKRLKNGFVTILTTYEKSNSTNKGNMIYRLSE